MIQEITRPDTTTPTTTDPRRAAFVAGLRELADFYEANPTMPMPLYPKLLVVCSSLVDGDEPAAELVRHAAQVLGVEATPAYGGDGLNADRKFGALNLHVYSTTRAGMARYHAVQSYDGAVEPEPEPEPEAAPAAEGGVSR